MHRCFLCSAFFLLLFFMKCVDLKPDNIGYLSDGTLKLMDFGLSTCVRARTNIFETYAMTGCTGSLRYMAPEVMRSEEYTEKVDVYGYGLVLYQLITNKLPYDGMKKTTLIEQVIYNNQRPKIKHYIPSPFFNLLTFCWHRDPNERPSFEGIMTELVFLSSQVGVQNNSNVTIDHADGGHIRHVASTDTTSGSLGYAFHAKPALDPIEPIHSRWSILTYRNLFTLFVQQSDDNLRSPHTMQTG